MGASTANISRRLFDERKRYVQTVLQQGVPLVDADYNEAQESFYTQIRRAVQAALGDGASGVAFLVAERREGGALVENDFLVRGGYRPESGPERLWVAGHGAALSEDVPWSSSLEIAPRSTGLTVCDLHDTAAFFEPGALVGRTLVPDLAAPENSYLIAANTANTITVEGNQDLLADGARPGDRYRVLLTTPVADRVDVVYVDAYLDEVDAAEDPDLLHSFSTQLEAMRRLVLMQSVLVAEGAEPPAPADPEDPLVDADGNQHFVLPIARLSREAGNPYIEARMVEDLRRRIFSLDQVEDRYVNADGDTMRGDLAFQAGTRITGEGVVGASEIQDESVGQGKLERETHLLGDGGDVPLAGDLPAVHDNRYYPKSVLATFFGPNLVVNGDFEKGLTGWIEDAPLPLDAGPDAAEKVRVGWQLCGPDCCRGLVVTFHAGFAGCEVCAAAQEIPVCGGGLFAWSQTVRVARGGGSVQPFLSLALYASDQFLGRVRVPFLTPVETGEGETAQVPVVLSREDGLRRVRALFDLDACVDRVLVSLCFEPELEDCATTDPLEVLVCDVRGWRFADEGSIEDGVYVPPPLPALAPRGPEAGGDGETTVAVSKTTKVPVIVRVRPDGVVVYRPAHRQAWLNVFRTIDPVTTYAWDPETGATRNPELVEVVPTQTPEVVTTHVGGEPGAPPPRVFTVSPTTWVIGETGHVVVTGRDLDPAIVVGVVPATGITVSGVTVSAGGDQVDFDLDLTGATVGPATLVLTNPDGQHAEVTIQVADPPELPVPTTVVPVTGSLEVTAGESAPLTVTVLDQFGAPLPGAEVQATPADPAVATADPLTAITGPAGQAQFTVAGVAEGATTITFAAGTAEAVVSIDVAPVEDPVPVVASVVPSPASLALGSGESAELTALVLDELGQPIPDQDVTATSSAPGIIEVLPPAQPTGPTGEASFTLQALAPGAAEVTLVAGGVAAVVPVSAALPPPVVEGVAPPELFPGTIQLLEVAGVNFVPGLAVALSPSTGIGLGPPTVLPGGGLVQVEVDVAPDALPGSLAVTVVNPDGQSSTLTGAVQVVEVEPPLPGEVGRPVLDPAFSEETPNSLRVLLDPNEDPVTILQGYFGAAEGQPPGAEPVEVINPDATLGHLRFVVAAELETAVDLAVGLVDVVGRTATLPAWTLTAAPLPPPPGDRILDLPPGVFLPIEIPLATAEAPEGFDFHAVTGIRLTLTPHAAPPGPRSTVWHDSFVLHRLQDFDLDGEPDLVTLEDFAAYPDQGLLDAYWQDVGAGHVVQVQGAISRDLVPVIVAPTDRLLDVKFHGDPGWEEADVVLVKATETNRAAGVVDEEEGIRYGAAHYQEPPFEGCRNVYLEPAYIAGALCRTVVARASPYEFVAGDCECSPEFPMVLRLGDFLTDPLLHRMLPDDGFGGTPTGYGEMFALEYCVPGAPGAWVRIGSLSTPLQVLHAGGGRPDPEVLAGLPLNPETGEPIYVVLHHGPGSPLGARESLIAVDLPVPAGTAEVDVIVSPAGVAGFAVGMPVWLRNDCHPGHPSCRISVCEVETSVQPSVTGLYGEVVALDPNENRVRVRFDQPPLVGGMFLTELGAALLVSPAGAMGFYWEPSAGLVDLGDPEGIRIRWWFRHWEAAASSCPGEAGVLLCDGDGESHDFPFVGETGALIDPADWRKTWSKPIDACRLSSDLLPGADTLELCTPGRFEAGDVVRVVDDAWTAGWRATVESVDEVNGRLHLVEPLPSTLPGTTGFDGFQVTRGAVAFRAVVRANVMKSPTTRAAPDGTPLPDANFVAVNFDAGRFTFDPSFEGPVRIFYDAEWRTYRLPAVRGIYKLQSVNFARVPGWFSDQLRVGPLLPIDLGGA